MVVTRVGGVGAVQAADVGGARPVGRLHVAAGILLAAALDRGALHDAEAGRAVEPHVEAAVLAEHHRRAAAQDHARGRQAADVALAVAAEGLLHMAYLRRWLRWPRPHRACE